MLKCWPRAGQTLCTFFLSRRREQASLAQQRGARDGLPAHSSTSDQMDLANMLTRDFIHCDKSAILRFYLCSVSGYQEHAEERQETAAGE